MTGFRLKKSMASSEANFTLLRTFWADAKRPIVGFLVAKAPASSADWRLLQLWNRVNRQRAERS